jgi:hypothetical protein
MDGVIVTNSNSVERYIPYDTGSVTVPEFYEKVRKVFRDPRPTQLIVYGGIYHPIPRDGGSFYHDVMHGKKAKESDGTLIFTSTMLRAPVLTSTPVRYAFTCSTILYIQKADTVCKLSEVNAYIKLQLIHALDVSSILTARLIDNAGRYYDLHSPVVEMVPHDIQVEVGIKHPLMAAELEAARIDELEILPAGFYASKMQRVNAVFNVQGELHFPWVPIATSEFKQYIMDEVTQAFYRAHISDIQGTDTSGNSFEFRMNAKYVTFPEIPIEKPLSIKMTLYDHAEVARALAHRAAAAAASSGGRIKSIPKKKNTTKTSPSQSRGRSARKLSKSPGRGSRSRSSKKKTTKRKK